MDYNDLKYEFGEYVQLHVTEKFTNNMKTHTIGAIVLGPRKIQGQYKYMSLESGEQREGRVVTRLPLTDEVIRRVEQLGTNQGQPLRVTRVLQYEWRPGYALESDDVHIVVEDYDHYIGPPAINQIPVPPAGSLDKNQKEDFLRYALDEYQLSQKTNAIERYVTGHIFTQLSGKQGIRRYGRMAELKLLAEFKQLLEYKTFHGRNPKDLSF